MLGAGRLEARPEGSGVANQQAERPRSTEVVQPVVLGDVRIVVRSSKRVHEVEA